MFTKRKKGDRAAPQHMLTCEDAGPVTYVRLLPHEGLVAEDLEGRIGELWTALETVFARRRKILVLEVPRDLTGIQNMTKFWEKVEQPSPHCGNSGWGWFPTSARTLALEREENAFRRFIEAVRQMDTFVICVLQGEVMLPFLGLALACDYRAVTNDTVFVNHCLGTGLPACGALPWFLVRHLGYGKAAHLLMNQARIEASEAFDLALVDRLVEPANLEDEVRACAERFAKTPGQGLMAMKRLLAAAGDDLETYLAEEGKTFEKWLRGQTEGRY